MASINLKWRLNNDESVASTEVYRSIIGFKTGNLFPYGIASGDTLLIKVNGGLEQTLTFPEETDINTLVDFINEGLTDANCYLSTIDSSFIIRSNTREAPGSVEISGGTALVKFGISLGVITEKSSVNHIGSVPHGTNIFADLNGTVHDYYCLATINTFGDLSQKTNMNQAVSFGAPICVIEGKVADLQGRRISDVEVTARIIERPQVLDPSTTIIKDELSTLSGEDGRFSLPILQGAKVIFEINRTRISDPIEIPAQDFEFFNNLPIYEDYRY